MGSCDKSEGKPRKLCGWLAGKRGKNHQEDSWLSFFFFFFFARGVTQVVEHSHVQQMQEPEFKSQYHQKTYKDKQKKII
jgi:hypothetical protein